MTDSAIDFVYEYTNPLTNGMVRVNLSRKLYAEIWAGKQPKWCRYEFYLGSDRFEIHRFTARWAIVANWFLMPVSFIMHGLSNYKDIWREHVGLLNEKKRGHFTTDVTFSNSKNWHKIIERIEL